VLWERWANILNSPNHVLRALIDSSGSQIHFIASEVTKKTGSLLNLVPSQLLAFTIDAFVLCSELTVIEDEEVAVSSDVLGPKNKLAKIQQFKKKTKIEKIEERN